MVVARVQEVTEVAEMEVMEARVLEVREVREVRVSELAEAKVLELAVGTEGREAEVTEVDSSSYSSVAKMMRSSNICSSNYHHRCGMSNSWPNCSHKCIRHVMSNGGYQVGCCLHSPQLRTAAASTLRSSRQCTNASFSWALDATIQLELQDL